MRRPLTALAGLSALALVAIGAVGAAGEVAAPAGENLIVTAKGAGQVKIGSTISKLRELKLIGGARKGCELAPGQRVAPLKPPLEGFAVFYPKDRVSAVEVTGGAETRAGIEVGSSVGEARKAYPAAPYDRPPGPRAPFEVGFLWIGGRIHTRMTMIIDPDTHRVSEISVPFPNLCE